MTTYKVQPGDTLSTLAAKNNTSVEQIMALNPNIQDPNVISVGANLNLPSTQPQTQPQATPQQTTRPTGQQPTTQSSAQLPIPQGYAPSFQQPSAQTTSKQVTQGVGQQPSIPSQGNPPLSNAQAQAELDKIQSNLQKIITQAQATGQISDITSGSQIKQVAQNQTTTQGITQEDIDTQNQNKAQKQLTQLQTILQTKINQFNNPSLQPQTFQNYYNQLAQQQGLPALDTQVTNLTNVINGTEDDIRKEISSTGGFATESQVQALVATRDKVLINELNTISSIRQQKQDWVNNQVTLYQQDQKTASDNFDKLFNYQDKITSLQNTIENTGFKQTLAYQSWFQKDSAAAQKEMDTMIKQGTLNQLTPSQITDYANRTGFTEDQIRAAMTNTDARYQLQTQILNNKITAASGLLSALNPNSLDLLSSIFLSTGNIPSIGYGQAGVIAKTQVINNAAAKANASDLTGADIAANGAAFSANKSALAQVSKLQAATNVYESNANKNFDQLLALSKKVDRTGSPVVNKYLLWLKGQFAGDADTQAFQSVLVGAASEYAKVVTGSLGSAAVTDSSRKEMENVLNGAISDKSLPIVLGQLRVEMNNRTKGFKDEVDRLNQALKNQSGTTSPIPDNVDIPKGVDDWVNSLNL